jgi:hypothetical protein
MAKSSDILSNFVQSNLHIVVFHYRRLMGGRRCQRYVEARATLNRRRLSEDDGAMTAVIEFLSSFVLFLMVVTAYLSLAQMSLGVNEPSIDRLDRSAAEGLERLTDDGGLFVPWKDGVRDIANATVDWQLHNASELIEGDVLPALVEVDGVLSAEKISALQNITEAQLGRGIGLSSDYQFRLTISVIDSANVSRLNTIIFDDGTPRTAAKDSATSSRSFTLGNETVRITLEVHDGARHFPSIRISEFTTRPMMGQPEWIEIHNPNGFAVNLSGWGLTRATGSSSASVLFESGVLAGGKLGIFTGWAELQSEGNSTFVTDISESGVLGVGQQDGLGDSAGSLSLTYADIQSTGTKVYTIEWDPTWRIGSGDSIIFLGGTPGDMSNWNVVSSPSPGDF